MYKRKRGQACLRGEKNCCEGGDVDSIRKGEVVVPVGTKRWWHYLVGRPSTLWSATCSELLTY